MITMCPRTDCTNKPMPTHDGVVAVWRWRAVSATDRVIRWSTALAVIGVAAVVPYEHASTLVQGHRSLGLAAVAFSSRVSATSTKIGAPHVRPGRANVNPAYEVVPLR